MDLRRYIVLAIALLGALGGFAQSAHRLAPRRSRVDSAKLQAGILVDSLADTLETGITERNQRLYDSIASKTQRKAVPRLLYSLLFTGTSDDPLVAGRLYDESRLLAPHAGKIIGEIRIVREHPFPADGNWLERAGNTLHTLTRESIIRRDLLFRSGERFDPELVVRTQRLLIARTYISDVDVAVTPDPDDPERVDITLYTRDSWSIQFDAALHSDRRVMVGLGDYNILGTGTRLKVETNLRRDFTYGGNVVGYEMPNILGSFFAFEIEGGRDFYENRFRIQLHKAFLKPTDYEVGAAWNSLRERLYFVDRDAWELIKSRHFDLWGGWSRHLPRIGSSLYLTGHYAHGRFVERPESDERLNPGLHNHDDLLAGIGLYRERLYKTNMVYGFGRKEYIATGFRAELLAGYSWREFDRQLYAGASLHAGCIAGFGYLVGGFSFGSYLVQRGSIGDRGAVDLDLFWFSNLISFRRSRVRQFVALNYTQGWNRLQGYEELLRFTRENGLQALDAYACGTTRLVVNSETVLFTPIQPWGFRFAFFGFLDAGTLGFANNPFRNAGFTSFGIGLRIRNERLIFGTLQLRLGLSFGKGGLLESDYFSISGAKRFEEYRFLPMRPEMHPFR